MGRMCKSFYIGDCKKHSLWYYITKLIVNHGDFCFLPKSGRGIKNAIWSLLLHEAYINETSSDKYVIRVLSDKGRETSMDHIVGSMMRFGTLLSFTTIWYIWKALGLFKLWSELVLTPRG
mgnify:CR=1 FL=1